MTELEQLRKEVNELRERVAQLEARPTPTSYPWPIKIDPYRPPFEVTCGRS